jgi:hypothetical protein
MQSLILLPFNRVNELRGRVMEKEIPLLAMMEDVRLSLSMTK